MHGFRRRFPQRLNTPIKIFFIEYDVFVISGVCVGLFIFTHKFIWVLLAFAIPIVFARIQKGKPRGYVRHILYMLGLTRLKGYPMSFEKRFHD